MTICEIQASRKKRNRGYIDEYKPNAKTRALLDQAQAVLDEYRRYWPLTCRQIFYRMVGAHGYDKTEAAYGRLCHHLANARRGKVIPFDAIRDDGTSTYGVHHFDDHDAFLRHVRRLGAKYTRNKLTAQDVHIEIWCEAAGMLPQLAQVADWYSVQVYSSGGFDSLTAKKRLAERICRKEKETIILHLGDYDPSGVSIFDSVAEDVTAFVNADRPHGLVSVEFERVTLTREQVNHYDLPTSPAKASDSRSKGWDGGTCQLEALPPNVIADILKEAIDHRIDWTQFCYDLDAEKQDRVMISGLLPAPSNGGGACDMTTQAKPFISEYELERLLHHMPTVAERATNAFAKGFAASVVKQSRRRNWRPSAKQLPIIRELVSDLFAGDGYAGGDIDLIES